MCLPRTTAGATSFPREGPARREGSGMAQGADSAKAVLYALGANLTIAVTKYVAAAITGSGSMLAEAVHSTADCANQLLLLLGMKRARRARTHEYTLGFGKET